MNINHISVSRKKTFDQCSQAYKFRYHLKVDSPEPEPYYFVYGTIIHKIAEVHVQENGVRKVSEIALDVLNGKIPIKDDKLCPPIQEDYKRKFQKHLKALQSLNDRIGAEGYTEYEFNYDLDFPNKKVLTGFIDRLIIKGEGVNKKAFIIDYKTTKKGKWRVDNKTVLEDLQLRCYARIVQKHFDISPSNIKAALFYLEGENLVAAQFNEESLIRAETELKNGYIQIEKSDANKVWGNVGWHCQNCSYKSICSFYKPKTEPTWHGDLVELGHTDNSWA